MSPRRDFVGFAVVIFILTAQLGKCRLVRVLKFRPGFIADQMSEAPEPGGCMTHILNLSLSDVFMSSDFGLLDEITCALTSDAIRFEICRD